MPWIGDINIPIITETSTSIDVDTVEKNFVDQSPMVYPVDVSLEAGTYSGFTSEKIHPRNETFEEQIDGVLSLADRKAAECPVNFSGNRGFVAVDQPSSVISPNLNARETEISLVYLPSEDFQPAFKAIAQRELDFYNGTVESVLPIPEIAETSSTPETTIEAEEGTINLYKYTSDEYTTIHYNDPELIETERISPVRLFDSQNKRQYSTSNTVSELNVNNGIVRIESHEMFAYYDDSWNELFTLSLPEVGYPSQNRNDEVHVKFSNGEAVEVYRGYPVMKVHVNGRDSFTLKGEFSTYTSNNFYVKSDVSGYDVIVIADHEIENVNIIENMEMRIGGLDEELAYDFYVGVVPEHIDHEELVEWTVNRGIWKRVML